MNRWFKLERVVAGIAGVLLAAAALWMNTYGAELETNVSLVKPACSLRVIVGTGIPAVWNDTGGWHEDIEVLDTTVTYTPGDFVQRLVEYKFDDDDSVMKRWEMNPFYSVIPIDSAASYGANIQAAVDSPGLYIGGVAGAAYSVSILTLNSADSSIVGGVPIAVRTVDQSSLIWNLTTSSLGVTSWNATADSFLYVTNPAGYIGPTYDTVIITGVQTDTIFMTVFDPGQPTDTGYLCRVYGWLRDLRNHATYGQLLGVRNEKVTAIAQNQVKNVCNNTWPTQLEYSTESNDSGYFFIDLVRSSCLPDSANSDSVQYMFKIDGVEGPTIYVPDSATYELVF